MSNEFDNSENQNNPYSSLYSNYGKTDNDDVKADASENTNVDQNLNNSSMNAGSTGSNTAASGNYYRSDDHVGESTENSANIYQTENTEAGNSFTESTSGTSYTGSTFTQASSENSTNDNKTSFSGNKKTGRSSTGSNGAKKSGVFKKAVAIAMSAVLFGGIAGGTMLGVQAIGKKAGITASETQSTQIKIAQSTKSDDSDVSTSSGSSSSLGDVSDIVADVLPSVVAITNSQVYENYSSQYGDDWSNFFNYYFGGNGYGSYGNDNGNSGNSSGNNSGSSSDDSSEEVVTGSGSGIIIGQNDSEILIVTNYHVIEDADSLTITFADDTTAKASVKGTDEDNDLAVVAVQTSDLADGTADNIAIATLDTKDDCEVGQGVIAIGNALGYGQSITVGYISALNRSVSTSDGTTKNLLQTDAAINPGNSGGALINADGEIIGINSAKYSDTDVEGMGFAIPISKVYDIIDDLMNQETKVEVAENQRGYLGINASTVDSSTAKAYNMPEGVYVYSILEGGAASKSELQAYDIITKVDDTSVSTKEDLIEALKYYKIGDTVTLTVSRNTGNGYEEMTVKVTLAAQVSN